MSEDTKSCMTLKDWRGIFDRNFNEGAARLIKHVFELDSSDTAWINIITREHLEIEIDRVRSLPNSAPLRGIPFAVKDNIDVNGWPTTAACREFAYNATADAGAVERLRAAGAIVIGKTNMDQFATGLVGTRSPWGAVPNAFNSKYISGGSSSGSAVAVARGWVPFALGTDTAGSGRVPAGFNNIIGLKPTRGRISVRGVVPACASLDCLSILAMTIDDASDLLKVATGHDPLDIWSRPAYSTSCVRPTVLGIPNITEWYDDSLQAEAWSKATDLAKAAGIKLIPIDFSPLFSLASLLYSGPWVAERTAAVGDFITLHPGVANPIVEGIIRGGERYTAVDTFRAEYERQALMTKIEAIFSSVDALLVPTTPTIPTLADVAAEPIQKNMQLGKYTNFVNLADLCAIALPAGLRSDGLPFGITVIAPAFKDEALLAFAAHWQSILPWTLGVSDHLAPLSDVGNSQHSDIVVAVVGAHLNGQPLNYQLTDRGASFLETTRTASHYRLIVLPESLPPKPGLIRTDDAINTAGIEVELWSMRDEALGSLMREVSAPLCIGTVILHDGRAVKGFLCEELAQNNACDITCLGGWRAYLDSLSKEHGDKDRI